MNSILGKSRKIFSYKKKENGSLTNKYEKRIEKKNHMKLVLMNEWTIAVGRLEQQKKKSIAAAL